MAEEQTQVVAETPIEGTAAAAPETQQVAEVNTTETPNTDIIVGEGQAPAAETPAAPAEVNKEELYKQFLAEQGLSIEDVEAIKAEKQKRKEEEEAPIREQKEWAEIVSLGIQNGILKKEDVLAYEQIAKADDKALVFEKFKAEYKNEDGLEGEELAEAIAADFEDEYNLATTSQRAKSRAEAILKAEADKIRSEKIKPVQAAQTQYQTAKIVNNLRAQHEQILKEIENEKVIEQEFEIEGEKVKIQVPLKVDAAAVKEQLKTAADGAVLNLMFDMYQKNPDAAGAMFKEFVKSTAVNQQDYTKEIVNAVMAKMDETYKAKYKVGAQAPFNSKEINPARQEGVKTALDVWREMQR